MSQSINLTQNTSQILTLIILFWERKAPHLHVNLNESISNVILCSLSAQKTRVCQTTVSVSAESLKILHFTPFSCLVLLTNSPFRHLSSTDQLNASIRWCVHCKLCRSLTNDLKQDCQMLNWNSVHMKTVFLVVFWGC